MYVLRLTYHTKCLTLFVMQKTVTIMERTLTFRCTQEDVDEWVREAVSLGIGVGELIRRRMSGEHVSVLKSEVKEAKQPTKAKSKPVPEVAALSQATPSKRCRFGEGGCVRMGRPPCEACKELT